ncbi:hypothetical protein V865_001523 [Kwoniella europaea PYCC6329]|uniref:Carboxylic ester hydrolase n=1 Tax=Kwoniella europaea PYCC6329 TaxID=1423913 RepID=A0AAX4KAB8_9TREE
MSYGPTCVVNSLALGTGDAFTNETGASEDCLFLNVQAPSNATGLPVFVWIHGGGYGAGNGRVDFSPLLKTNDNEFIGVAIQYRLGAFGFLAGDEVNRFGSLNAGLQDQQLALYWVQQYIHLFGGDPSRVTIGGESAGGGSVMLQSMAYGGSRGTELFNNVFASSPYLPQQYDYRDFVPEQAYSAFAQAAGCLTGPYGNTNQSVFACLQAGDSATLINASASVSEEGVYGTWAFVPVTGPAGSFVQELPSQQLLQAKINGKVILSGNNANEGYPFVPKNVTTEDEAIAYLKLLFPFFSEDNLNTVLAAYKYDTGPNATLYATAGDSGDTANDISSVASGPQQQIAQIYSETTFVCPSYWLAEAFTASGGAGYKYQFSIPPATHGGDVAAYFGNGYTSDFSQAFQTALGTLIIDNKPSIPSQVANGLSTSNTSFNPASDWPVFSMQSELMINLNTTCTDFVTSAAGVPTCQGADNLNEIREVDAYSWEGGRGARCELWRSLYQVVPE